MELLANYYLCFYLKKHLLYENVSAWPKPLSCCNSLDLIKVLRLACFFERCIHFSIWTYDTMSLCNWVNSHISCTWVAIATKLLLT